MAKYVWMMGNQVYPKADPLIVKSGERVRVELTNTTSMYHPMHLHGHFFRVLGLKARETHAPLLDTVSVPPFKKIAFEFLPITPADGFFPATIFTIWKPGWPRKFTTRCEAL